MKELEKNRYEVETFADLALLYDDSSLTLVGLREDSIPDFIDWIKVYSEMNDEKAYITKGAAMNMWLHLTDENRYPDDLTIVSVMLGSIKNVDNIIYPRFQIEGRWMDDVIDNNLRREGLSWKELKNEYREDFER